MIEPADLGEVRDYDTLICALRARKAQLQLSDQTVDALAGWSPRRCGKVLGPRQERTLGLQSLGILLTVLGLKLLPVEDAEAVRRMEKRWETRQAGMVRGQKPKPVRHNGRDKVLRIAQTSAVQREALKIHMRKIGKKGGLVSAANRMQNRSKRTRSRIARQAARARWRKPILAATVERAAFGALPRDQCRPG